MRIRMSTIYAGPHGTCAPGGILDLPEASAYDLIERGYAVQEGAEAVPQPAGVDAGLAAGTVDSAVLAPPATAEAPANRRRRGR